MSQGNLRLAINQISNKRLKVDFPGRLSRLLDLLMPLFVAQIGILVYKRCLIEIRILLMLLSYQKDENILYTTPVLEEDNAKKRRRTKEGLNSHCPCSLVR